MIIFIGLSCHFIFLLCNTYLLRIRHGGIFGCAIIILNVFQCSLCTVGVLTNKPNDVTDCGDD